MKQLSIRSLSAQVLYSSTRVPSARQNVSTRRRVSNGRSELDSWVVRNGADLPHSSESGVRDAQPESPLELMLREAGFSDFPSITPDSSVNLWHIFRPQVAFHRLTKTPE